MKSWKVSATVRPASVTLGGHRLGGVMLAVAPGGKGGWEEHSSCRRKPRCEGQAGEHRSRDGFPSGLRDSTVDTLNCGSSALIVCIGGDSTHIRKESSPVPR